MKSYSITQWCEMHSVSRSYFYLLATQGKAPKTFRIGRLQRISAEANAEWVKALESEAVPA